MWRAHRERRFRSSTHKLAPFFLTFMRRVQLKVSGTGKWRLGTFASLRSSSSVFGLRRFVSPARQAHIRFRVTVISQPALWLNLYLDSRAEATFARWHGGHYGTASTLTPPGCL